MSVGLFDTAFLSSLRRSSECAVPSVDLSGLNFHWVPDQGPHNLIIYPYLDASSQLLTTPDEVLFHITVSNMDTSDFSYTVLNNTTATGGLGIDGALGWDASSPTERVASRDQLNTNHSLNSAAVWTLDPVSGLSVFEECTPGGLFVDVTPFVQCSDGTLKADTAQGWSDQKPSTCPPCGRPDITIHSWSGGWADTGSGYDLMVGANVTENSSVTGYWVTFMFDEEASGGIDISPDYAGSWTYQATDTVNTSGAGVQFWGKLITHAELGAGFNISDHVPEIKNYSRCDGVHPMWKVFVYPVKDCESNGVRYHQLLTSLGTPLMYDEGINVNLCWSPPAPHSGRWTVEDCEGNQLKIQLPSGSDIGLGIPVRYNDPAGSGAVLCTTTVGEDWTGSADLTLTSYSAGGAACDCSTCLTYADLGTVTPSHNGQWYSPPVGGYHSDPSFNIDSALGPAVQLVIESKLEGRPAADSVVKIYGQSTNANGTYQTAGYIAHLYSGTDCFINADEDLTFRLRVDCGAVSGGSWSTVSSTFGPWQTININHQSAGQQCATSGGDNYTATDCQGGGSIVLTDSSSYGFSVGDYVDYYLNDGSGPLCAEITGNTSASADGDLYGGTYTDCTDCTDQNGIALYEVTDCNDGSVSIVVDDAYNSPSIGDVVEWYDDVNGDVHCGTVTDSISSGSSVGYLSYAYTDCTDCNSANGNPGGGGGSTFQTWGVATCNSDTVELVTDEYVSGGGVGDYIGYYDDQGNMSCGEIVIDQGMMAESNRWIDIGGYYDCPDCNSYYGL